MSKTHPPATLALLDEARRHLTRDDVWAYVGPSDPGWPEYLAQMLAVHREGASALVGYIDSDPLSDAIRESPRTFPSSFLWYRIMGSSAALLCSNDLVEMSSHHYLARILVDSARLRRLGHSDTLMDLAPALCREVAERHAVFPEVRLFATLGELIAAGFTEASSDHVVELAGRFANMDQEQGESLWEATHFDSYHHLWLHLVRRWIPTDVEESAAIRELLLEAGERWIEPEQAETPIDDDVAHGARLPPRAQQIAFALGARTEQGREMALSLAEETLRQPVRPSDDAFEEWLSMMNNAVHVAHADKKYERAARLADVAKRHAGKHRLLPHNLACAYAAVGRTSDAIAMCAVAIETGSTEFQTLKNDEDLRRLRSEKRFKALGRR